MWKEKIKGLTGVCQSQLLTQTTLLFLELSTEGRAENMSGIKPLEQSNIAEVSYLPKYPIYYVF